jgi:glycolate oxidase FAD binding subunit
LHDVTSALNEQGQMLPFEPPGFGPDATLAGTIACGLAGPRRPWTGAVRDYLLGVRILSGTGKDLRIGSAVMKNVAGYDLFRPMAGALGTLGILLEVIIKVLPRPALERSFTLACNVAEATRMLIDWQRASLPLSGACHIDDTLYIRLSGSLQSVKTASATLPNSMRAIDDAFWHQLNEHTLPFFSDNAPLYRLTLPATASLPAALGQQAIDWGGRQRWLYSDLAFDEIQRMAIEQRGHACAFRNGDREADVFPRLPAPLMKLEQRIRRVLDPDRIINPGRLYRDL